MRRLTLPFTLIFLAALAVDAYPGLRGGGGWRWPYALPDTAIPVLILAVTLVTYLLGVYVLQRAGARPWLALMWMVLGGTALGYAVTGIPHGDAPFTLFTRTVSPVQTGASTVAVREMADNGLETTLDRWPDVMREALDANIIHFTTSPPGQPLIHYGLAELTDDLPAVLPLSMTLREFQCADETIMRYTRGEIVSAGVIGLLMPLLAALAVVPIYAAAGMLLNPKNDHQAGYQRTGQALFIRNNSLPLSPLSPGELDIPSSAPSSALSDGAPGVLPSAQLSPLSPGEVDIPSSGLSSAFSDGAPGISPSAQLSPLSPGGRGAGSEGDTNTSLRLAAWWPLVPTVLLFAPTWNTLYPALCVTAFALLLRGMIGLQSGERGYGWIVGAGVVMSFTTFLNFAVAPVFLLFGLFTLGYWWLHRADLGGFVWPVRVGMAFGGGLLSVWMVFGLVSGHTPLDLAQVTADKHSTLVAGRDYLSWLLLHPYDVLMFVGWPLAALFIWGVLTVTPRRLTLMHVLAASMLVTVLAVNVAGVVQGENARILAFYAPFMLLAGGGWLMTQHPRGDWPLLATQAACVLVMGAVLPVVPLDLNPPPDGPDPDVIALDFMEPVQIEAPLTSNIYDDVLMLDSYRFVADVAAQTITLETIWQGVAPSERPYVFEVVATANNAIDGNITADTHTFSVQNGNYPPTCWQDGERIRDVTQIALPVISAPVQWTLTLTPVDPRTGHIMQVRTLPFMPPQTGVTLGPISYP